MDELELYLLSHSLVFSVKFEPKERLYYCDLGYRVRTLPLDVVLRKFYSRRTFKELNRWDN